MGIHFILINAYFWPLLHHLFASIIHNVYTCMHSRLFNCPVRLSPHTSVICTNVCVRVLYGYHGSHMTCHAHKEVTWHATPTWRLTWLEQARGFPCAPQPLLNTQNQHCEEKLSELREIPRLDLQVFQTYLKFTNSSRKVRSSNNLSKFSLKINQNHQLLTNYENKNTL